MREVCYCGCSRDIEDREPVVDGEGRWTLRCPACGQLDYLQWLSDEAGLLLWDKAKERRGMQHRDLPGRGRAA